MELKGKVVLVTGATGGIGSAIVKILDQEGVNGLFVARNEDKLKSLVNGLASKSHKYYPCDLASSEDIIKVAKQISSENSKIDVILNCAGVGVYKPMEEITSTEWDDSFSINVKSSFLLTQNLLPNLDGSDSPLVLSIGSGAGVIPMAGRCLYCSTKFALRGLILSLVEEFEGTKYKFCLITLGSTLTEFGPMTIDAKRQEMLQGKAYFTPEWVGQKLIDIVKDNNRDVEYTIYPTEYGLGNWAKPKPVKSTS